MTITNDQIRSLKRDAGEAGDLAMVAICDLALGDVDALIFAEPGTEADSLLRLGRSCAWARAECEQAIASKEVTS